MLLSCAKVRHWMDGRFWMARGQAVHYGIVRKKLDEIPNKGKNYIEVNFSPLMMISLPTSSLWDSSEITYGRKTHLCLCTYTHNLPNTTSMICRMDQQWLLMNAVGEDTVINNFKVVNFCINSNKVTLFLENGEQHEGDLLVGADGVRSMVCVRLFGDEGPNYSNFMCYAGVAEFHKVEVHHQNHGKKLIIWFQDWDNLNRPLPMYNR